LPDLGVELRYADQIAVDTKANGEGGFVRNSVEHAVVYFRRFTRRLRMATGVKRDEVQKRYMEVSGLLSSQCRNLGIGILAFLWALMTKGNSAAPGGAPPSMNLNILGVAALTILVLLADAGQYYAALKVEERCLRKFDRPNAPDIAMYDLDLWYEMQYWFFHTKFVGFGLAVAWLLGYLVYCVHHKCI
jgi:hypothetical protein